MDDCCRIICYIHINIKDKTLTLKVIRMDDTFQGKAFKATNGLTLSSSATVQVDTIMRNPPIVYLLGREVIGDTAQLATDRVIDLYRYRRMLIEALEEWAVSYNWRDVPYINSEDGVERYNKDSLYIF